MLTDEPALADAPPTGTETASAREATRTTAVQAPVRRLTLDDLASTHPTVSNVTGVSQHKQRIHPTVILDAFELATVQESRVGTMREGIVCKVGQLVALERLGVRFERMAPGTRTSYPHAHRSESELVFCISGSGILWQNGYTYQFNTGDAVSWKSGTGIAHTIINDSNRDDGTGEELVLLSVSEKKANESWHYPISPERRAQLTPEQTWKAEEVPPQEELGSHPGLPCRPRGAVGDKSANYPPPEDGSRPSNIVNAFTSASEGGHGDMFARGCCLTASTGLQEASFGCHLDAFPPGTRSSSPHAHSEEEEFVFVLRGTGHMWLNGDLIPVGPGDCVGFPRGTGIAHNFINDSNATGEAGHDLVLFIMGENLRSVDKVVYPVNPERKTSFSRWWHDAPEHKLGSHNGCPKVPRT
ncbi:RmlC-like cupin domain-containing protein [Auriculariales sp. MPI-PUGE-AT-0066]|nr:RmlC-like cupin domain-containing protein [Auriculariales sp. MPI-PUGE-AT-0066]